MNNHLIPTTVILLLGAMTLVIAVALPANCLSPNDHILGISPWKPRSRSALLTTYSGTGGHMKRDTAGEGLRNPFAVLDTALTLVGSQKGRFPLGISTKLLHRNPKLTSESANPSKNLTDAGYKWLGLVKRFALACL